MERNGIMNDPQPFSSSYSMICGHNITGRTVDNLPTVFLSSLVLTDHHQFWDIPFIRGISKSVSTAV